MYSSIYTQLFINQFLSHFQTQDNYLLVFHQLSDQLLVKPYIDNTLLDQYHYRVEKKFKANINTSV